MSSLLELCLALLVEGEARRPEDRQRPHIRLNTALIFPKLLHIQFKILYLKVPKREIFVTELFILSDPIWVGDLRNEPKKPFV